MLKNCPITQIEIVKAEDEEKEGFIYTFIDADDGFKIGYSKLAVNFPLTKFELSESFPCQEEHSITYV